MGFAIWEKGRDKMILTILGDIILGCMFAGFYALGVSAGRAATRQEPENSIAMEHRHGGEDDRPTRKRSAGCGGTAMR